ncbi:MAG: hypothetical protein QG664_392 [Patescibacteria group bacterium]|nr:hypothetical protein [Patescibacteria group bacterium]
MIMLHRLDFQEQSLKGVLDAVDMLETFQLFCSIFPVVLLDFFAEFFDVLGYFLDILADLLDVFLDGVDVFRHFLDILADLLDVFVEMIHIFGDSFDILTEFPDILAHFFDLSGMLIDGHLDENGEIDRLERDDRRQDEEYLVEGKTEQFQREDADEENGVECQRERGPDALRGSERECFEGRNRIHEDCL